ncbi:MAG: hypothetical protein ACLQGV_06050 [Bryobacteraceae bacterium]
MAELREDPENASLAQELSDLRARIEERLNAQRAARREAVEKRHAEAYAKCRAAVDKVRDATREVNQLRSQANYLGERASEHWMKVLEAEGLKPNPRDYPTQGEIEAWRESVARAEAALQPWNAELEKVRGRLARANKELQEAKADLAALQEQEKALRDELDGKRAKGPYGLLGPPRPR